MKMEDKIIKIREHFYATNLSKTDFHKQFFEMYGYQNADSLRKYMIKKNITSKDMKILLNVVQVLLLLEQLSQLHLKELVNQLILLSYPTSH